MLRKLSTLVLCLIVATFTAQAQTPPDNEIWYTTTDGKKAELCTDCDSFDENGWYFEIISHTYSNGLGIIHANKAIRAYGWEEGWDGCNKELSIQGDNLRTITFPKCTEYFYGTCFSACKNLRTVKCRYSSSDGRFLIKDGCLLDFAPGGLTKYTIPNTVTKIGQYAFEGCSNLTSITIPQSVTEIENGAFYNCNKLLSITIPNSVTEIGEYTFSGCSSLKSITIPNSVTSIGVDAFARCSSLTSITIPNSVTYIGSCAFCNCTGLKSITIPNSIKVIEYNTFNGCTSLTNVTISNGIKEIAETAFMGCSSLKSVTIPESVKKINSYAFASCKGLTSIAIPYGVTSINHNAFAECTSLTSVTISESITEISSALFANCSSLKEITIPCSVTKIGSSAFKDCSSLASITIPESVTEIGAEAFKECHNLKSVTIHNGAIKLGNNAFSNCNIEQITINAVTGNPLNLGGGLNASKVTAYTGKYASEDGRCLIASGKLIDVVKIGLDTYTIPDGVTEIGQGAFANCNELTSVIIPESVIVIGERAFNGCNNLVDITIPKSTTTIGRQALAGCKVKSITIPDSVTEIGEYAFWESSIDSVTLSKGLTKIGARAFWNVTDVTIPNIAIDDLALAFEDCRIVKTLALDTEKFNADCIYLGNLEELTLGPNVKDVAEGTFTKSFKLKRLTINTEHFSAKWVDLSNIEEITIAPGITLSDSNALNGFCGTLIVNHKSISKATLAGANPAEIRLGENVENIEYDTFSTCSNLAKFSGSNTTEDGCNVVINGKLVAVIQKDLTEHVVPEGVTEIGSHVFKGCTSLTSVNISESVKVIGKYAFYGCCGLTSITLPKSITKLENGVFAGCGLTSIDLPNSITSIGEYTFYECSNLTTATIAPGVTSIGACAFKDCSKLKSITIPNSVTSFGKSAFDGCNIEQITVNAVTGNTFSGCEGLSTDKVVAYKGDYASADGRCIVKDGVLINILHKGVVTYTIPSEIKVVNRELFKGCSSLVKLFITENVTEIGAEAFKDCSNLKSVIIANSVTSVGKDAFAGCNIEQIVINAVTGNKLPYGNGLSADKVVAYTGKCASEDGLCLIKHGTLIDYLHRGNTTYTIPEGVKVISSRVFSGCSSLVEVIIAESVAEIGTEAFKGCSGITSVTIPAGTTWIGEGAFSNCSAITEITSLATLPPTISDLGIAETVVIYVPKEAMKEYKKDPNWARYLKQLKRAK